MSKTSDYMTHHLRLAILQTIDLDPGNSLNHVMIVHILDEKYAYSLMDEEVKEQLEWMAGRDLVVTENVGRFKIARLTHDGERVARGIKHVPGIAEPDPRD